MWTVGVIGIGSFGQKRVETLLGLTDQVEKVVIFDQDLKLVDQVAQKLANSKLTSVQTAEDIFNDPNIEIICISSPNSTHPAYCLAGLEHNKHVLCAKPITADMQIARGLVRTARKHSRLIMPGTNHRYFPSIQQALALVKDGKLGKLYSLHASIGTNGKRIQKSWFWKKELAVGGTMIDNGHHLLDLALLFCGPFEQCMGHTSRRQWQDSEVEDYAVAIFEASTGQKKNGYEAVLRSSWRQPDGYLELELWGEKGLLKIVAGAEEKLTLVTDTETINQDFSTFPKDSLQKEVETFLELCQKPEQHLEETSQLLLSLTSMIQGFYHSQHTGRISKLRL
ncbi:Gfo/Idh/MocA family oxidoreductase [Patescibacteria group bacterium]|nr:Gfo/Idh/MocA family oxidoreductase [Patescibacteria group bacterium]